jgi:hypothetical protein
MVFPFRSEWRTSTSFLIVSLACSIFAPDIDDDVSRRNPAMMFRGAAATASAAAASICGVNISSLPNLLLFSVRRLIKERTFSGMNSWDRIPLSVVVSRVESIVGYVNCH